MAWERVLYEKDGYIVKITQNRPEKHNAQDALMLEELQEAFIEADRDEEVRVVILTGAGRSFSAGHDIGGTGLPAKGIEMQTKLQGLEMRIKREKYIFYDEALALRNISKPSIAAVRGACLAGGLMVAAMCDIIMASETAFFGSPEIRMTPATGEVLVEPWEVGVRKAKEMVLTGESINAQEAYRLGLVNHVVPDDKLEEETLKMAHKICATDPITASLLKRSLNQTLDVMGQRASFEYHFLIHQMSHSTEAARRFQEQVGGPARARGGLREFLKARDGVYGEQS
ncbi:MAG: enoyl-CoA hydratase [Chloroflexi bacterium]|nr:enoyl-CoA hydratase [Chloroflexota bacterium]